LLKFIIWLFVLTLLLAGSLWGLVKLSFIEQQPSFAYQTLFLLAFATGLIYRYLYSLKKPEHFVQLFLLLTVVKLVAFLGYNFFMVIKDKPGAKYNVVFFLIAYFLYTFFEIVFLYRRVSSQTEP
jgi:hypothetical protein